MKSVFLRSAVLEISRDRQEMRDQNGYARYFLFAFCSYGANPG